MPTAAATVVVERCASTTRETSSSKTRYVKRQAAGFFVFCCPELRTWTDSLSSKRVAVARATGSPGRGGQDVVRSNGYVELGCPPEAALDGVPVVERFSPVIISAHRIARTAKHSFFVFARGNAVCEILLPAVVL